MATTHPTMTAAAGDAGSNARAQRAGEKRIPWILLAPTLLIMTLVGFFPLVHSLYVSMTSLRPTEADKPQGFNGIENYIQALADPQFGHSLRRTCRCSTTSSFP
jgi:multiple sugar transport system permease protein